MRKAVRARGFASMEEVGRVILENDPSFSVIPAGADRNSASALVDVERVGMRRDSPQG